MKPACMDERMYELWREANRTLRIPASSPCFDCPLSFAVEMRALNCCDGEPQSTGRPQLRSDDPRVTERRRQVREAARRYRARKVTAA